MKQKEKKEQKRTLEKLHAYWMKKIAEAKETNDLEALQEAEANYIHTESELLKLQPKSKL